MLREIVLDTETTGLDHKTGDRLIEIGCVELKDRLPTGKEFHCFVNPQRDVPAEAVAVHGISAEFLADKPIFSLVAEDFIEFIQGDPLVIHNANFDIGFLNMELDRIGLPVLSMTRVIDTLQLARRKHPAGPNNLDALCKRYGIDNSKRVKHGAITDSLLLAEVYIELLGERQASLGLAAQPNKTNRGNGRNGANESVASRPKPLPARLTQEIEQTHRAFVNTLGEAAIWKKYLETETSE